MNDKNDKTETFEFNRIKDSEVYKRPVERKENDIYSEARKANYEDEKSDKKLISVIIGLMALIIVVAVAGLFLILNNKNNNLPEENTVQTQQQPQQSQQPEVTEPEPPVVEEEPKTNKYEAVFYGDEVDRKSSYYVIKADLMNISTGEEDLRRIKIDSNTEIRKNGDRIIVDAFISLVEELAGEQIVYQVEVDEEEDFAKSISFSANFGDEEPDEEVTDTQEPEASDENSESNNEVTENEAEPQTTDVTEAEPQTTETTAESVPETSEE